MKKVTVAVLAILVVCCATNPATGRRQLILMTERDEIALGPLLRAGTRIRLVTGGSR